MLGTTNTSLSLEIPPRPTEASSCFLTPPAHHLASHLISVHQTTLATSQFLLSVQHHDAGQDRAWLSGNDPQQRPEKPLCPDGSCLTSLATQHGLISLHCANGMPPAGSSFPASQCSFHSADLRWRHLHPGEVLALMVPHEQAASFGGSSGPTKKKLTKEYVRRTSLHCPVTPFLTPVQ
uniref:Uncharacterized protein n=1 Tax=Pipistrellus kuhlii TaxID=59472 RepID=A0A7J7VUM8_PIPKU|nr:hypothetical protein mPipKuh1_008257 [Pipistrellus kuhlii]